VDHRTEAREFLVSRRAKITPERAHLFDLAQAADGSSALVRPRRRAAKQWSPRPSLQWTLDAVTEGPAFVRNRPDVW
jgi:hypothetical protein